ncbi:hypothetical protein DPSP01_002054 [Paraphaeosphaeria sporulosa]
MGCHSSKPTPAYQAAPAPAQHFGAGNSAYDAYAAEQYAKMKKDKKKKKAGALGAIGGSMAAVAGG